VIQRTPTRQWLSSLSRTPEAFYQSVDDHVLDLLPANNSHHKIKISMFISRYYLKCKDQLLMASHYLTRSQLLLRQLTVLPAMYVVATVHTIQSDGDLTSFYATITTLLNHIQVITTINNSLKFWG